MAASKVDVEHVLDMAGAWVKRLEAEGHDLSNRRAVIKRVRERVAAMPELVEALRALLTAKPGNGDERNAAIARAEAVLAKWFAENQP